MSRTEENVLDPAEAGRVEQKPMREKLLDPFKIKYAEYNPPDRVSDVNVRPLAHSMANRGLIYPVLVDTDNVLIEGHRRVAAARMLSWKTIRAYVIAGEDRHQIYADVNSTSKRMSGNDALGVWLKEPQAVTRFLLHRFDAMQERLGRVMVVRMQKAGLSLRAYNRACAIAGYCDQDSSFVPLVVQWFLECETLGSVQEAMSRGVSQAVIIKAVKGMKPIRVKYES